MTTPRCAAAALTTTSASADTSMRNLDVFMAPSEIACRVQGVFEPKGFGKD
jgi:hypothetical protein